MLISGYLNRAVYGRLLRRFTPISSTGPINIYPGNAQGCFHLSGRLVFLTLLGFTLRIFIGLMIDMNLFYIK